MERLRNQLGTENAEKKETGITLVMFCFVLSKSNNKNSNRSFIWLTDAACRNTPTCLLLSTEKGAWFLKNASQFHVPITFHQFYLLPGLLLFPYLSMNDLLKLPVLIQISPSLYYLLSPRFAAFR